MAEKFDFRKIWILGFGFLGISLLWSVYNDFVPVLLQAGRPDFSRAAGVAGFGLDTGTTGLIMGLDNLAALFILPYIGALSDRTRTRIGRRKPFILAGAPVAAVAFAAVPFLLGGPLPLFMGGIMVTLLAMDLFRTPVVALMPDLTPPHLRSSSNGIINFMGGLGGVIAQLVGGWLFGVSPIAPFLLGAGGMLIAQAILVTAVREPVQPEAPEEADVPPAGLLVSFIGLFRNRERSALLLLAAICCWFLGQSAFDAWFTSFAIQQVRLDTGQAVLLKLTFTAAALLSALPCGAIGARIGRPRAILVGLAIFAVCSALLYGIYSGLWMRPVLAAAGFGWMLVVVNSLPLVLDFAPEGREGTFTGLYYLASQTAAFVGPVVSGWVLNLFANDYRLVCIYAAISLVGAWGLMLGVRPATRGHLTD
ncbi:MAG: Major facilitator superfamily transporter [Armatimonadetes bacterium]|nr:Major facilitator superfamily transporter [Armatimonadota bacterium]